LGLRYSQLLIKDVDNWAKPTVSLRFGIIPPSGFFAAAKLGLENLTEKTKRKGEVTLLYE
jgi:hypothetical protein